MWIKNYRKESMLMWVLYAFGSAFFAGITSILAKCGIKRADSDAATAIRTGVVLIFSWLMVFIVGSEATISQLEPKTWIFLVLSGIATGASWLCYFKALQLGDINKVVPIDKSSTVLTILLAFIFLGEEITWLKAVAVILIATGTFMMIQKKEGDSVADYSCDSASDYSPDSAAAKNRSWLFFALFSAVFASLTSILGKIGIENVESTLGTAIRTCVVLVMTWLIVFMKGKQHTLSEISGKELLFICLSGIATGASWLCYYKALQDGQASVVVPIDKLSIIVSIVFSFIVFKERLSSKALIGLLLITTGTFAMLINI